MSLSSPLSPLSLSLSFFISVFVLPCVAACFVSRVSPPVSSLVMFPFCLSPCSLLYADNFITKVLFVSYPGALSLCGALVVCVSIFLTCSLGLLFLLPCSGLCTAVCALLRVISISLHSSPPLLPPPTPLCFSDDLKDRASSETFRDRTTKHMIEQLADVQFSQSPNSHRDAPISSLPQ